MSYFCLTTFRSLGGVGSPVVDDKSDVKTGLLTHVDLASEKIGGTALWANDEWFASASNLFKPGRGIFQAGVFTDRGQLMDG